MTPWVKRLIFANVGMYFLQMTVGPGFTDALLFVPAAVLIHPWTLVTYMFLHASPGHIFGNMFSLYFLGPRVESRLGADRFLTLYLLSGISGGLLSCVLAPHAPILGASGAVFGVMIAYARFWPRDRLMIWGIIPIEARVLIGIMVAYSLYSGFTGSTAGIADFAHLGGVAGGWGYLAWLDRRQGAKRFRSKVTPTVAREALQNWKKVDPKSVHEINRDEVNRILDKISKSGLSSLTLEERVFLSNFVPLDDRVKPVS